MSSPNSVVLTYLTLFQRWSTFIYESMIIFAKIPELDGIQHRFDDE